MTGQRAFLIAVSLILALAVDLSVVGLDILVGWILVLAGGLGLVTSFVALGGRRRGCRRSSTSFVRERTHDDGAL